MGAGGRGGAGRINALTNNKLFFDHPVKNKQEVYEKPIEISRNDDYNTLHDCFLIFTHSLLSVESTQLRDLINKHKPNLHTLEKEILLH